MVQPLAARPMAFLSDVHGNLRALEAVLARLKELDVDQLYVAGDHLLGGEEPLEVWRRLSSMKAHCTRGIGDTALARVDPDALTVRTPRERERLDKFLATRKAVGELVLEQLRRLPDRLRIPLVDGGEIVMVHGSPADPSQEISFDLSDDEVLALVADDPADIVVCGATHVPFQRRVDGIHIVNVGSVGAAPEGGVAHFCVVTPRMDGTEIHQMYTEYV